MSLSLSLMACNDGRIPGGPIDEDVVRLRVGHRSSDVYLEGKLEYTSQTIRMHSRFPDGWRTTPTVDKLIDSAGFEYYRKIVMKEHDRELLFALAERWWPRTCTFHFQFGEATITLEDVAHILGLNIRGNPITVDEPSKDEQRQLIYDLLGYEIDPRNLTLTWLRETFGKHPPPADLDDIANIQVVRHARAYLLAMCGATLFPDGTGTRVHPRFLKFLRDLSMTSSYSWGSAVLANLYSALTNFVGGYSKHRVDGLCGCVTLLQAWAYERFPCGRPQSFIADTQVVYPRALRWTVRNYSFQNNKDPRGSVISYRQQFDTLNDRMVNWWPYTAVYTDDDAPPPFLTARLQALHRSCVIYLQCVLPHPVDRVLRQVMIIQTVPNSLPRQWGPHNTRACCASKTAILDWYERFDQRFAIIGETIDFRKHACPWEHVNYRSWYGSPRVYNPATKYVEPRYIPSGYTDQMYDWRIHCMTRAVDDLTDIRDTADDHIYGAVNNVIDTLNERPPPHVYQWPQPSHHVLVPPRPLPVRRLPNVSEDYVERLDDDVHDGEGCVQGAAIDDTHAGQGSSHGAGTDEEICRTKYQSISEL